MVRFNIPLSYRPLLMGDGTTTTSPGPLPPKRLEYLLKPPRVGGGFKRRNFYVLGGRRPTFIVFPKSGHVIATGIREPDDVKEAVDIFAYLFHIPRRHVARELKRVNATYSGGVVCVERVCMSETLACYQSGGSQEGYKSGLSVTFRSQFFPSVQVKWVGCKGTLNLFNNGKYVLVGVRDREEADKLYRGLCALMEERCTTIAAETSCAWSAEGSWTCCSAPDLETQSDPLFMSEAAEWHISSSETRHQGTQTTEQVEEAIDWWKVATANGDMTGDWLLSVRR